MQATRRWEKQGCRLMWLSMVLYFFLIEVFSPSSSLFFRFLFPLKMSDHK